MDPAPLRRRCAWAKCNRWFVARRRTQRHCTARCRDAAAHDAQRTRARDDRMPVIPIAVSIRCPICRTWVLVRVRPGGTPQRYCDRTVCRKTAEKIAGLTRSSNDGSGSRQQ